MGQMASSMAGAMAGSVIGHGISRAIFGGGENETVAATSPAEIQQQQSQMPVQQDGQQMCSVQAKDYITCLNANSNPDVCKYFLEQLDACRAAAAPY